MTYVEKLVYIYIHLNLLYLNTKKNKCWYPYISNATLFVYTQLLVIFTGICIFIDAFQKVYHSPTGSGLDKEVYFKIAMFEMKASC